MTASTQARINGVTKTCASTQLLICMVLVVCSSCFATSVQTRQTKTERVTIQSGEWKIIGDLLVPESTTRVAAVILLNKAAGNRNDYRDLAEALATRGIASLRLDLRGHGESTNLGRFVPAEGTAILKDSERDVSAASEWLQNDRRIDPARIGFVGASYSGEVMMQAGRTSGYGAAYVGLSPGSLSDESIAAIDREQLPWLLIVARNERHLKEVAAALRSQSKTAEFLELSGTEHATDLLAVHPDLADRISIWFSHRLVRKPSHR